MNTQETSKSTRNLGFQFMPYDEHQIVEGASWGITLNNQESVMLTSIANIFFNVGLALAQIWALLVGIWITIVLLGILALACTILGIDFDNVITALAAIVAGLVIIGVLSHE